jgi:glycosyltransferase involved in cell wall biosynthesis
MKSDGAGDERKMRVLFLTFSRHPFVRELEERLYDEVEVVPVTVRGLRPLDPGLLGWSLLFSLRLLINRSHIFFRMLVIFSKNIMKSRENFIQMLYLFSSLFFTAAFIYRMHAKDPLDIIHSFWSYPAGLSAVLVKDVVGIPVVISVLGYDANEITLENEFLRELSSLAVRNADFIIAGAENLYLNLVQKMGVDKNKVQIITPGVDAVKFNPDVDGSPIRMKYGFNEDVVVAFGPHLRDIYGPEDFLRAAAIVSREAPNVSFILIGDGPLLHRLNELARDLGIKAVFVGRVPYNEMPMYYAASDIYCMPCYAGQGVSVLEAMASGRPVIGYRKGTIKIEDNRDGFLVDAGDIEGLAEKILVLIRDPDLRRAMGENARRRILSQFDIAICAKRMLAIYEMLLGRNKNGCEGVS